MNIRRVFTLLGKELLHGPRGFVLTMVIGAPLLITLIINLALGNLLSSTPELAVYDEGQSRFISLLEDANHIRLREYYSAESLREAVSRGAADSGIILPEGLDMILANGGKATVTVYIWGESLARDRAIIINTLMDTAGQMSLQPEPIILEPAEPGNNLTGGETTPWSQRLLPLTILIAVFFGGLMLPATSLIEEKQKRTLQALVVTPASLPEIFLAKGIIGAILSLMMAIIIILINWAWGSSPALLLLILIISAIMAAQIGAILGTVIKDMNTLFAVWKFGGLILFGPAFIYMFPGLPQWLNYFFPTYYVMGPVIDITLGSVNPETWLKLGVALAVILVLALIQTRLARHLSGEAIRETGGKSPA